jgi:hypothetical protein
MIDFLRALRAHAAYKQRLVSFAPALIVSELFYKFHSFTLECIAFLATWLAFDVVVEWVAGRPVSTSGAVERT